MFKFLIKRKTENCDRVFFDWENLKELHLPESSNNLTSFSLHTKWSYLLEQWNPVLYYAIQNVENIVEEPTSWFQIKL